MREKDIEIEAENPEEIAAEDPPENGEDAEPAFDEEPEDDVEPVTGSGDEADEGGEEDSLEPVETLSRDQTRQAIYAMLFASDRPLSAGRLAEALGDIDKDVV